MAVPIEKVDSFRLIKYFELNTCAIVDEPHDADYILFITCGLTNEKADESLAYIGSCLKLGGELIVLGCLPSTDLNKLKQNFQGRYLSTLTLDKIDEFFSDFKISFKEVSDAAYYADRSNIKLLKEKLWGDFIRPLKKDEWENNIKGGGRNPDMTKLRSYKDSEPALLRIGRGCVEHCAFCSIVRAVGRGISKPIQECVNEYKDILSEGFRHVQICADNTGAYGLDINSSLIELLNKLGTASEGREVRWGIENLHPRWVILYKTKLLK